MLGLRITVGWWACLALVSGGCGNADLAVGAQTGALSSCNDPSDCLVPGLSGTCVGADCVAHECQYITDLTACPSGCTVALTDCQVTGACNTVPCNAADATHTEPWCDFNDYTAVTNVCGCTMDSDCHANVCQKDASCQSGTCTYAGKAPIGSPCCNVNDDCGTATCTANVCSCNAGQKYCPATSDAGRCVPSTGCCVPTDCGNGNVCQTRTCSVAGACGFQSNGNPGCCDDATADCGGTATCVANTCTCGTNEKFCPGASAGMGSCIPSTGCCSATDCAAHADATAACTANACVYTCDSGFHDCSGTCMDDTSVASCGTSCTACPAGNACQAPSCSGGACGFVAGGGSPCCNVTGDCTPANACQQATACTSNQCVFGSTGGSGCCDSATDCPTPADACLQAACVANQCATAPVSGCSDDGGMNDLSSPAVADLASPSADQATLSLSGGGGCAFAAAEAPSSPRALALVFAAIFVAAFVLRRRRA